MRCRALPSHVCFFTLLGLLLAAAAESARGADAAGAADAADPRSFPSYRTRHYLIHSDIDPTFAADLGRRMDAMFDEYQRRWPHLRPQKTAGDMQVYLFRKQSDYLAFTGQRWRNSGGVYMSARNLLVAFLEGQGRDSLRRTLQHEAFHQFAHLAVSPDMPPWLGEGLAQLFEEGLWTGDGFLLGEVPPRRIRQLREDVRKGRLIPFDRLLAMSNEAWAEALAGEGHVGATQYNQSWAMVHFLVHARDASGREKYRSHLLRMLDLLRAGKDGTAAFNEVFAGNVKGFQKRFVEYAHNLAPTPGARMIERQDVLAALLIELAAEGKTFKTMADFRALAIRDRYTLRYSDRNMTWQSDPDVSIYFSNADNKPLQADAHYFSFRAGAPLPDMVCRVSDRVQFRTRFHPTAAGPSGRTIEHEVLIESPASRPRN